MLRSWVTVRCASVIVLVAAAGVRPAAAQSLPPAVCAAGEALPPNLQARGLAGYLDAMLEKSPSFRAQCQRIASYGRRLKITIAVARIPIATGYRASAKFR